VNVTIPDHLNVLGTMQLDGAQLNMQFSQVTHPLILSPSHPLILSPSHPLTLSSSPPLLLPSPHPLRSLASLRAQWSIGYTGIRAHSTST
jgi:hypothetical protein